MWGKWNTRPYEGIHTPASAIKISNKTLDLRASGMYYKIKEFKNVTALEWTTHQREVVMIVDIDDSQQLIQSCQLNISVILQSHTAFLPVNMAKGFLIHYISPIVFPTDEVPPTETYNIFHQPNGSSSWLEANRHCEGLGGELHGASSNDERHRLFYNVHYMYERQHFHFWKSQLIFIGGKHVVGVFRNFLQ